MAIRPEDKYPGQTVTGDGGYPHGKARNITVSGDGTGTPLEQAWLNDLWGLLQSLLEHAAITPSGTPDEVGASQYLTGLRQLLRAQAVRNWSVRSPLAGSGATRFHAVGAGSFDFAGQSNQANWRVAGAATNSNIQHSAGGHRWSESHPGSVTMFDVYHRSHGSSTWIAVGAGGAARRSDLVPWTDVSGFTTSDLLGVVYEPVAGKWITVGDDDGTDAEIFNSVDGTSGSWSARADPVISTEALRAVAVDGLGTAIAVGHSGKAIVSTDGGDIWADRSFVDSFGFGPDLNDIQYDATRSLWVAVAESSGVFISEDDGENWSEVTPTDPDIAAGPNFNAVAIDDAGMWVAVGDERIAVSLNKGQTWKLLYMDNGALFDDIAWSAEHGWLIVGQDDSGAGLILQAARSETEGFEATSS